MGQVGILTFHRASNYGAVLQAYALQTALQSRGVKCEIVDYFCPAIESAHDPKMLLKTRGFVKGVWHFPVKLKKYQIFEKFRERRLILSQRVNRKQVDRISGEYDFFIVGSDQVWSNEFAGLDLTYLLDFVDDAKKYSYACSLGFDDFPDGTKEIYQKWLQSFKYLSVRERSAKSLIEKSLKLSARRDVDPTFLLYSNDWRRLLKKPNRKEAYILVYTVQPPENLLAYARKISRETGNEIIYLNNEHRSNRDIKHVRYATPEEFLGWIDHAEYVLTNSYHGTVFSIIFNKKFCVECITKKRYNSRSKDLLLEYGLEKCELVDMDTQVVEINWNAVEEKKNAMVNYSINYLLSLVGKQGGK